MTTPLHSLQAPKAPATAAEAPIDPKALQTAREFEAIFLRTLLHSVEKTTSLTGKTNQQSSTYGGMVVGAMADSLSNSGGIGLAEIVARSLSAQASSPLPSGKPSK